MVERTETPRAPAWGDGPGAVALAGLVGMALAAFWFSGVPRLAPGPAARSHLPPAGEVHLGGEAWVPLADPIVVRGTAVRLIGRSNEGYLVYASDAPPLAAAPAAGGGGGGGALSTASPWPQPIGLSGVAGWDPPRERLYLAAPGGRWLPLRKRAEK